MFGLFQKLADAVGDMFGHHVHRAALPKQVAAGGGRGAEPAAAFGEHFNQGFHHGFNQRRASGGGETLTGTASQVAGGGSHVGLADNVGKRAAFVLPAQILPQRGQQFRVVRSQPAAYGSGHDGGKKRPRQFGMQGVGCFVFGKGHAVPAAAILCHITRIGQPQTALRIFGVLKQFHVYAGQGFADVVQQRSGQNAETPRRTQAGNIFGFRTRRPAAGGSCGQREHGNVKRVAHQPAVARVVVRFGSGQPLHESNVSIQRRQRVAPPVFVGQPEVGLNVGQHRFQFEQADEFLRFQHAQPAVGGIGQAFAGLDGGGRVFFGVVEEIEQNQNDGGGSGRRPRQRHNAPPVAAARSQDAASASSAWETDNCASSDTAVRAQKAEKGSCRLFQCTVRPAAVPQACQ